VSFLVFDWTSSVRTSAGVSFATDASPAASQARNDVRVSALAGSVQVKAFFLAVDLLLGAFDPGGKVLEPGFLARAREISGTVSCARGIGIQCRAQRRK